MEMLAEAFSALIHTAALLSSFLAAGVFTDNNVLKTGVPQGLFNALCLILTVLFFAIGGLIFVKTPIRLSPEDSNSEWRKMIEKIIKSKKYTRLKLDAVYIAASLQLILCGILLLTGLSVFLLEVVCVQFDESRIPNCRAASIGITVWLVIAILGAALTICIDYLIWMKRLGDFVTGVSNPSL